MANDILCLYSVIAGSGSGILVKCLTAPIDRIRIIYQVNKLRFTYRMGYHTAKRIIQREGLKGLWRGNSASVLRIVPYSAIQFTLHEQLKSAFQIRTYDKKAEKPYLSLVAGGLSGAIAISCTYPLDVARARLAVNPKQKSVYSIFEQAVVSKDARYGLYRGFSAAALAVIPYSGVSFFLYEHFKMNYFTPADNVTQNETRMFVQKIALGTWISFLGQTLIYPLDVVRRRMQVDIANELYTFRQAWKDVYLTNGLKGYYKGLTLAWIKTPLVVGVGTATFDYLYNRLVIAAPLGPPEESKPFDPFAFSFYDSSKKTKPKTKIN